MKEGVTNIKKTKQALYMNEKDNVIMATVPVMKGEIADAGSVCVEALEDIPRGHKLAIRDISAGEPLIKYGKVVGRISADVKAGAHVHCHNVDDITEQLEVEAQEELLERLEREGLVTLSDGRLALTERGFYISNSILIEIL